MTKTTGHALLAFLAVSGTAAATVLPDPTRPPEYRPQSLASRQLPKELVDWKVTAIRIAGEDRSAIINGNIVREGDSVGAARILEIQPVAVVLDYENRKLEVRLFADLVRKNFKEDQ